MTRNLSVLNLLSTILLITISYFSQAIQLNNNTIGSVSEAYENLFTPAGYAFSIWGLIYVALIVYCIFQLINAFGDGARDTSYTTRTGPWFIIANLSNSAWIVAWLYEATGLSVLLIFAALISLIFIVIRTNMERADVPLKILAMVWWPICLYSGWIAVAAISNVAAYLTKLEWSGGFLSDIQWTVVMLVLTVGINLLIVYKRNMREFAAVGVWALIAIYFQNEENNLEVAYTALGGAILTFAYISYHAYINRKSNPVYKLLHKK